MASARAIRHIRLPHRWRRPGRTRRISDLLFGRPLATDEAPCEQIGPVHGVPILGLDALASAAYGPEAALTVLLPIGVLGLRYIGAISVAIVALLSVVYFSYRQTISAYPNGGGSFTVAKENLGPRAGLFAAAALALDYILNVAVAISAGIGALVSAVPSLLPFTLPLCLAVLAVITLVNVRGVRSSGLVFILPTVLFVGTLFVVLGTGLVKVLLHGGSAPPAPPAHPTGIAGLAGAWLLLRSFSAGCTAMTGVEAVSNGVPLFRPPTQANAKRSLTLIIVILAVLVLGEAALSPHLGVIATGPGQAGYQSVLSQLTVRVAGRGALYALTMASVVGVLMLSANTSFAGFPRLCRLLALDGYLPEHFAHRGRRLVFTHGIYALAALSAVLLLLFRGVTNGLIPLFAVGAFLAFTLSQAGMVAHWRRLGGHRASMAVNAVGAVATGGTALVILSAKFVEGAWVSVLLVGGMLVLFGRVHAHFAVVNSAIDVQAPLDLSPEPPPIVIVPMRCWNRIAQKGMRFAVSLSPEVFAVQVVTGRDSKGDLTQVWGDLVEAPARAQGRPIPELVVVHTDYRELFRPLLSFIHAMAKAHPGREIAVVVPELVQRRWYHFLLQSHAASVLKAMLLLKGGPRVIIINTPWYLREA